jgi:hypothetical protein
MAAFYSARAVLETRDMHCRASIDSVENAVPLDREHLRPNSSPTLLVFRDAFDSASILRDGI